MVFLSSYTTQNLATEPEVTKAQIPGMYAGGGDAMHLKKNPWLFRIRPADELQALALAKHATEGLGKKKIGIIYVQNDFGSPALWPPRRSSRRPAPRWSAWRRMPSPTTTCRRSSRSSKTQALTA